MKFYTNIYGQYDNILVRGVHNGQRFIEKVSYKPTLFERKTDSGHTVYRSLFGTALQPVFFDNMSDAREHIKKYSDAENKPIYGNSNFQYQYITENYSGEILFNVEEIVACSIDIETTTEYGFPNVDNPMEAIQLITVVDMATRHIYTYGLKPYNVTRENHTYVHAKDEIELLNAFLKDWDRIKPDVITGWNVNFFDIPYIVSRTQRILGGNSAKVLSPWRLIKDRPIEMNKRILPTYEIIGLTTLDYLDLYKKFTYSAQESYKLDYICKQELGVGKLENPYDTFKEWYTKDWQTFVDYNVIDAERVVQLDDKMKLLELVYTLAYDAKACFVDVFSSVRLWDCNLCNHLWDQNIIVHPTQRPNKGGILRATTPYMSRLDRTIEGAFVQDPKPGQYDWVVSFDATSLYPSIIMQYNMSPETLVDLRGDYKAPVTVDELVDRESDLSHLTPQNMAMTANGYHFTRDKKGIFPVLVEKLFDDRQVYKKKMIEAQKLYEETKLKKYHNDISRYMNFQMARKIQLNSLFGAMANFYFRYFDDRIAEGITMTGQTIIRTVGKALNKYLNDVCQTKDYKYSFYSDTDSCYITLNPLVEKFYKDKTKDQILSMLDKICNDKIEEEINKACNELASYTNAYEPKIKFKREIIADRGIWVAKKRYALNVYDNEGVRYKEPKLKVMGLEIVRSSTPEAIRDSLREAVKVAITRDEQELQEYIRGARAKFDQLPAEEIAFPRGVSNLDKYQSVEIYGKGTPLHVRAALLYNHYLKEYKLTSKHETIREGDKIKYLYLKVPNSIKENCIGFIGKLPTEFNLKEYVDYDTMWDKSFIEPLNGIIEGMGWKTKPEASLAGLFI